MKRTVLLCCLALLALTACQLPNLQFIKDLIQQNKPGADIVQHDAPDLKVDNAFFTEKGCFDDYQCLEEELKRFDTQIGFILPPSDYLGGLIPKTPIALVSTVLHGEDEMQSVYVNRCLGDQYIRFLIYANDELLLIDSIEGMAEFFAPIDSPEEALSYAIATTGFSAIYDLDETPKLKLYNPPVAETSVSETEVGYVVHLFDTYLCGCGPHIAQSVAVIVHKDGTIETSEPLDAFSDPDTDGLCID